MISVSIGAPLFALAGHWEALEARAAPNVFMHPAALAAAAATRFAQVHVLAAWSGAPRRLVGLWALRERRIAPFWSFLAGPPYDYAFVGSPVVDPDDAGAVMPAFLDAIANEPALPNVIRCNFLDAGAPSFAPMMAALAARRGQVLKLAERARPFLSAESERKRSGATGKKLRQDWNRLSALGSTEISNERSAEAARGAFEIFLNMESRSWKGASGTALLSHDEDAAFARRLIGDLAETRNASVALLRHDGRPVAAQVLLYSGTMAYTWKTAFDAEFSKFSPGALLIDRVTDELFASGIRQIESCSPEDSFMAQLWTGRRTTVDLLVDVAAENSAGFALAAMGERGYHWLRGTRNRLRDAALTVRRKNPALTRS